MDVSVVYATSIQYGGGGGTWRRVRVHALHEARDAGVRRVGVVDAAALVHAARAGAVHAQAAVRAHVGLRRRARDHGRALVAVRQRRQRRRLQQVPAHHELRGRHTTRITVKIAY